MSRPSAVSNRAGKSPSPSPAGRRRVGAFLATLIASVLTFGIALAQVAPVVGLGAYDLEVGQTLEVSGDRLTPGADYRIAVGPVGGAATVSLVQADTNGSIRFATVLEEPGDHGVSIDGQDIHAAFTVSVRGSGSAPAAAGQATGAGTTPPAAGDDATGQGTQPTTEDAGPETATPETTAPERAAEEPGEAREQGQTPGATTQPAQEEAPAGQTQAPPTTTEPRQDPIQAYPTARLAGGEVQGVQGEEVVWRLGFPAGSGETAGLVQSGLDVYVGHGNHVLKVDARTGKVTKRHRLPAQVTALQGRGGALSATVAYSTGAEGSFAILETSQDPQEPFDDDPALYGWLRKEAAGGDPVERLEHDETNPWLYLEAARAAAPGSSDESRFVAGALSNAVTFYERAQLAREFMRFSPQKREEAATAMHAALDDFVARGYRAELLFDQDLAEAYGFPLGAMTAALGRGDVQSAGFWADWVYLLATPAVPQTQAALAEYAAYLRADGQREASNLWRERAREGAGFDLAASVRKVALDVGRTGWYGVVAILVALLALYVALAAKYWRPQTLNLRRRSGNTGLGARLFFLRYATFTEKLVAVLLLAAAMALAALHGWAREGDSLPRAWRSGSLASVPALDALARLDGTGSEAEFVRGFAEQSSGADDPAAVAYRAAGDDADAVNNLGALLGDQALYQRALELKPGLGAASFNMGRAENPSRLMAAFAPDAPALVVPDETRLRSAVAGTFQTALVGMFTNPWAGLTGLAGVTLPQWAWSIVVIAFLLLALFNVVMLLLPRPREARNAPRTPLYHLLAILLPGTGQADELWGVLLSVPWAVFGVDLLLHFLTVGPDPAMSVMTDLVALTVIYVVNLVAYFVELASYRRRMQALKQNDPETARAYGMRRLGA